MNILYKVVMNVVYILNITYTHANTYIISTRTQVTSGGFLYIDKYIKIARFKEMDPRVFHYL